ncbi:undecaprenyldiphospho-muramoylpentapeptide beta-N-acetylglucosaminyltransferase [Zwartia panacis]|uniref:undecaprenyldiphospho-muramoylpentapeptide beta-N-acetylglucosaminyltransferase n=1 Tax=Zwartia panacis TaxID=2683345 RepID=UPI0025B2C81C|nr:undecaprenyldiphospho-muramoylpentapeptide beta-N-acetylglucosaminyltransferase [Zwartia panacis]MDN4017254.1 undecaprenyldiphospho-muramoylpentapeptide beta-N-acetylglucosaminyltransferase [Zwartia panacis]
MTTSPTILIMAGGTGGHIMPGLAVADVLRDRGWTVRWLGHPEKMEGQIVPARGYELAPLRFAGLRGRGLRAKAVAPFLLMRALWQAWGHFSKIRPNVVLGMGGYVSFPGGVVSALRARPLVLHEQNAIAGMANKVLARISKRVLAGFPGALVGAEVVGNPVRHEVVALEDPLQRYSQRTGALRLLVVGGSLGATALNNMLPEAIARLPESRRPEILHQSGAQHLDALKLAYQQAGVRAECVAFIDNMADALGQADILICRAGAMTVAEVAAAGVAALFVPYPHAVDDHQTANARFLSDDGSAWLMQQESMTAAGLSEWLGLRNRQELAAVAQRARVHARPLAAQRIANICEELVGVVK